MGIFTDGMDRLRSMRAVSDGIRTRTVTSAALLGCISETLMQVDGYTRDEAESWTRYGSNAAGEYDYKQLQRALIEASAGQRRRMSGFLGLYPDDPRAAGTIGRVAIDLMGGADTYLLENTVAFYRNLDIIELREDYWYYPLDVIRGIGKPVAGMSTQEKRQVSSVAMFTLISAVSIGGLRFFARYQPDGSLVLRDEQVRDFISGQSFDVGQMRRFIADHPDGNDGNHVAVIEAYFSENLPAALRQGHL
jgi:hypothetical protein